MGISAAAATEKEKEFVQPQAIHEQWHIDFSYIKICGGFYYFLSILDGFSRKILVWDLFEDMEGIRAELLLTKARECYPLAKARIISDNAPCMAADSSSRKILESWRAMYGGVDGIRADIHFTGASAEQRETDALSSNIQNRACASVGIFRL
jgi:transposase InsO family protein